MTEKHIKTLQNFESLVRVLISKHDRIKTELDDLKAEMEKLDQKLLESYQCNAKLKMENASLKLVSAVNYSLEEAIAERERLKNLIRRVDKCISLLK